MLQACSRHWVLAVCVGLFAAAPLASGCGDDENGGGDAGMEPEACPQAGGLDDGCVCASNRPAGIRRCQDNLLWSACMCGPPYDDRCEEGDPVECTCPGESRPRTTICLAEGTFDCACDSERSASGDGD